MNTYTITILDDMFGEFTDDFEANSQEEACNEAKEFYAMEMDTTPDQIQILKVFLKQ